MHCIEAEGMGQRMGSGNQNCVNALLWCCCGVVCCVALSMCNLRAASSSGFAKIFFKTLKQRIQSTVTGCTLTTRHILDEKIEKILAHHLQGRTKNMTGQLANLLIKRLPENCIAKPTELIPLL
jgi:hypothetical protein